MNVLNFTGERIVPQADNCEPNFAQRMYQEHIARYNFCLPLCVGKDVIDVGCGVGYGSQSLAARGAKSVFAFDISSEAIAHARRHYSHPVLEFGVENAEDFMVKTPADVVVCFELIEHVNKPEQVLRRIRKALKPDGILVMSTPRALERKRTHFHVHEFSYGEFEDLLSEHFPSVKFYSENNHFVSVIGSDEAPEINQVEYIEGLLPVHKSDVFIAVASTSLVSMAVELPKVAVVNSDEYVVMLERDVEILHRAEDDLKEKLEAQRVDLSGQADYYKSELGNVRLLLSSTEVQLHEALDRAAKAELASHGRDEQLEKVTTLERDIADCNGRIAALLEESRRRAEHVDMLEGDVEILHRAEDDLKEKLEAQRVDLSGQVDYYKSELGNVRLLLSSTEVQLHEALDRAAKAELAWHGRDEQLEKVTSLERDIADCNGRIAALVEECRRSAEQVDQLSRSLADREGRIIALSDECARQSGQTEQLGRLAAERADQIRSLNLDAVQYVVRIEQLSQLGVQRDAKFLEAELKIQAQSKEIERLTIEARAFEVRLSDAESRRAQAYDYARGISIETNSWRSRYEILKRDLFNSLYSPTDGVSIVSAADRGHAEIIRAVSEQFPGVGATHYLERDELLLGVDALRAELRSLQHRLSDQQALLESARASSAVEFERRSAAWAASAAEFERRTAELANRVCSTESEIERVVNEIRNSTSWRITRPVRSVSVFVRRPVQTLRNVGKFASDNGLGRTTSLVVRKLTGIGRDA